MAKRTKKFKTEVKQLLDLVINSLYSKKEIFLRELISNASDAIDRARFEALTDKKLLGGDTDWKIKIAVDKDKRTLTVSDNGIGMSAEEVEKNIGTIANSGTRLFLENIQQSKDASSEAEFIGQFGVGFYSAFMAAEKVELITQRAGKDQTAVWWVSSGGGNYTIEETEKDQRGTDIILHLREGLDEYLEEWRLRSIVKDYSDFIAFPIVMDVTRKRKEKDSDKEIETTGEETLNSMKAIWKKAKDEVTEKEYFEFYKHITHDFADPLKVIHYHAEGTIEYRALIFIPTMAPFDLFMPDMKRGLNLYVKNVFITDDCRELLPEYLRFVRGVVDSSDLPLNISREMLQDDAIIRRIRKSLIGKVFSTLEELKKDDRENYDKFFEQFGRVLKEGLHFDFENVDQLKELVLYSSTKTEDNKLTTLGEYVERMPKDQKDIYYITAENHDTAARSPHLEIFRKKGYEVLFMVDPVDEFTLQNLTEYDGKKLKPVHRGEVDIESDEEKKEKKEKLNEADKKYQPLIKLILKKLEEDVSEVKLSHRLTDSAVCLVAETGGMDANMERIMKALNKDVPRTKRIMEINPDHALIEKMRTMYEKDKDNPKLTDYIELLHEQALLTEGNPPRDPLKFTRKIAELMVAVED